MEPRNRACRLEHLVKVLKGIFVIVSILCIAFTCFFVFASATGHTGILQKIERGILTLSSGVGIAPAQVAGSGSTVSMLTDQYGLSTSQAGQVIALADELGIDTSDPVEMNGFIIKNVGNKDEIQNVAEMYQNGEISESQAKSMLKGIVNY